MDLCFFCGQGLNNEKHMHKKCTKKLFTTNYIPKLNLTLKDVVFDAQKMAGKLSISGVQPKLSIKLNKSEKELEPVAESGEYILKPQTESFPNLPQNENLCMTIASCLGIDTAMQTLVKLQDNSWAYVVKRFDRNKENRIHQEDFFQILEKEDKYRGSVEEIGSKLKKISDVPGLDVQLFYERVLFNFIIGNGDAHFKNFSITYHSDGAVRLSKAYDIVSSKLVIPNEEDMALSLNGKKNKITGRDFQKFAEYLEIPKKVVKGNLIDSSILSNLEKETLLKIVADRFKRLRKIQMQF
ncbi:type II toxin-antitoxin system HipA family toxin [bacterium]